MKTYKVTGNSWNKLNVLAQITKTLLLVGKTQDLYLSLIKSEGGYELDFV